MRTEGNYVDGKVTYINPAKDQMLVDGEIYRANKDTIVKDVDSKVVALGDFAGLTEGDEVEVKDNVVTVKKSATAEVAKVVALIDDITANTPEADKVAAARKAYDALNTVAKDLVPAAKVTALESAEAALEAAGAQELVDTEAAKLNGKTFADVDAVKAAVEEGIEVSVKVTTLPTDTTAGAAKVTLTKNEATATVDVVLAKLPLTAPANGSTEAPLVNVTATGVRFLVAGLEDESGRQEPVTLAEAKAWIDEKYDVNFNADAIVVTDGYIEIVDTVLSTEDWNKIKEDGNKTIPYRITVMIDGSTVEDTAPNSPNKAIKIAIYEDGKAVLE